MICLVLVLACVAYAVGFVDGRDQERALRNIDRLCNLVSSR